MICGLCRLVRLPEDMDFELVEPQQVETSTTRRFELGRGAALALGSVAVVNLVALIFVVHALGAVRGMVRQVGGQVVSSSESVP